MYIKNLLVCTIFYLVSFSAMSQDTASVNQRSKIDIALEGMVGVAIGEDFYSLNVGGPAFFVVWNKNLKIGVGALPSLYLLDSKLGARLGVAPRVDYKHLAFFMPFYHRDQADEWIWSIGAGYKFHRK